MISKHNKIFCLKICLNIITLTRVDAIQSLNGASSSLKDPESSGPSWKFLGSFSESNDHYFTCISMNVCIAMYILLVLFHRYVLANFNDNDKFFVQLFYLFYKNFKLTLFYLCYHFPLFACSANANQVLVIIYWSPTLQTGTKKLNFQACPSGKL